MAGLTVFGQGVGMERLPVIVLTYFMNSKRASGSFLWGSLKNEGYSALLSQGINACRGAIGN
jgi:hypothetical protein